jgi:hypothetical protein
MNESIGKTSQESKLKARGEETTAKALLSEWASSSPRASLAFSALTVVRKPREMLGDLHMRSASGGTSRTINRTQGNIAVAAALALVNTNHHAFAIDVANLETTEFVAAHGGGIQGHEQGAVIEVAGRVDESSHLLRAEHGRQSLVGFWKRNVLGEEMPMQCLDEQEAQGGDILRDRGWS